MAILACLAIPCCVDHTPPKKETTAKYTNSDFGISMSVPKHDIKEHEDSTVALFYVSIEGVHVGNVNLGIHTFKTTREQCLRDALTAIASQGQTVNSKQLLEVNGHDAFIIDSQGHLEEQDFRFLALTVVDTDRVLVVTCAAPLDKFEMARPQFMAVINSVDMTN
jgi:hypothetical protein